MNRGRDAVRGSSLDAEQYAPLAASLDAWLGASLSEGDSFFTGLCIGFTGVDVNGSSLNSSLDDDDGCFTALRVELADAPAPVSGSSLDVVLGGRFGCDDALPAF